MRYRTKTSLKQVVEREGKTGYKYVVMPRIQ